jgi:hypothetical protein
VIIDDEKSEIQSKIFSHHASRETDSPLGAFTKSAQDPHPERI